MEDAIMAFCVIYGCFFLKASFVIKQTAQQKECKSSSLWWDITSQCKYILEKYVIIFPLVPNKPHNWHDSSPSV